MKSSVFAGAIVLVAVAVLIAFQLPAAAATTWTTGVKVANPGVLDAAVWSFTQPDPAKCRDGSLDGLESTMGVKLRGDYVYVNDQCADGRSAVGRVQWQSGGSTTIKICRNTHGNKSWARCNFNWPEGAVKTIIAGAYNGDTGYLHWDHGASIMITKKG